MTPRSDMPWPAALIVAVWMLVDAWLWYALSFHVAARLG